MIANRQLYTFILNVEDSVYAKVRPAFDALIAATSFRAPNTGADLLAKASNRWIQREYKFALDLPDGWGPVLAPSEVALLFANGPPHGVWSDNLLVLAHSHRNADLQEGMKLSVIEPPPDNLATDGVRFRGYPHVAELNVISVADSSAVCDVITSSGELKVGEFAFLTPTSVEDRHLAQTARDADNYPIIVAFTDPGDGEPLRHVVRRLAGAA